MQARVEKLDPVLARLDATLTAAVAAMPSDRRAAIDRWRADADALRFHLRHGGSDARSPLLVAIIGGTGTGKSTIVNRLAGRTVTAASFRRTFTTGPVAVVQTATDLPENWLGLPQVIAGVDELPARGRAAALVVVELGSESKTSPTAASPSLGPVLIDTPDLDGDQPAHHAQADRVFRWTQAVLFAVTPEKYQMTELQPYYRLALRYGVPALYVMNKCEEQTVADDYARQLGQRWGETLAHATTPDTEQRVFVIPRDDAGYEPPPELGPEALRAALKTLAAPPDDVRRAGLSRRAEDLLGRFSDQVLAPLRDDRREADRLIAALRSMEAPATGVDVNPLTLQLQRRLQQKSILYLMGPQRILERVRQAPTLLARLPRVAWDYFRDGEVSADWLDPADGKAKREAPDFKAILTDHFAVLQSRIDDVLRSSGAGERWVNDAAAPWSTVRLPPESAGRVADEELADLKQWLEKRWNATPRDTRAIQSLLKYLPGGKGLSKWTEAAPYLLTVVLVTHGAIFGHLDLMVLGGYSMATWLGEKISNEVTLRTRATNARIESRFAALAHDQIVRACEWVERKAPPRKLLEQLERAVAEMSEALGV